MNKNNTFKQCFSLSKPLFGLLLLLSFSCANATLPGAFAVATVQEVQTYRIQKDDTLWGIANKFRQDSTVSVEQMMLALLKANPQAFSQGNIHGIKLGYVMRMPGIKSIKRIDKLQAKAEVKRHAVLWQQYQRVVLQSAPVASVQPKQTPGSGGGLFGGLKSAVGSSGSKVIVPKPDKSSEIKNLLGQLSSAHKSIEVEKQEKKVIQDRLFKLENTADQAEAEVPPPKTITQNNEVASTRPVVKDDASEMMAEEVVLEDETPMIEEKVALEEAPLVEDEESQPIESLSAESAAGDEQPMTEESDVNKFDKYSVVLKADKKIVMPGLPGSLTVWIGDEDYKPTISDDKVHDEALIAAVSHYAVIEPFSTAFVFEPAKSGCIKIHSTGSEEQFELTPKEKGVFEVGVKVNLYDSEDCSNSPVPKSSSILEVTVEVDNKEIVFEKLNELWEVFWEKLLEFWAAFLVVTFGLIMFLYKNKLKKLFNFDSNNT